MHHPHSFEIDKQRFLITELIDKRSTHPEILRLRAVVKENDNSYTVNEPIPEDIVVKNDNWSCHCADELGITFEFMEDKLCYIFFDKEKFHFSGLKKEYDNLLVIENECEKSGIIAFLSKMSVKNNSLPNRFLPFLYND